MPSGQTHRRRMVASLALAGALAIGTIGGAGLAETPRRALTAISGMGLLLTVFFLGCRSGSARAGQLEAQLRNATRRGQEQTAQLDRLTAILGGLAEPVIAVDGQGQLLLANPSAERLFEMPLAASDQRAAAQLARCEKLVALLADARDASPAESKTLEVEIADCTGHVQWFNATARPLADSTGGAGPRHTAAQGAVAVLRDISQHKTLQKRSAEFVSAVSHEMKTPLAGIKAYVELLVDGDADDAETQDEFLSVIISQTNRLQRLVDNLLKLARIESGVAVVNRRDCSLGELLAEAVRVVLPAADKKRIAIEHEPAAADLHLWADPDMIVHAVVQLLSNAIQYTPAGGQVALCSLACGEQVQIQVQDTGVGLCAEDCERVFEKFYRVEKDKDMAAGTGLGLALTKHIIEDLHRGRLSVESVLGQGSVFTASLPAGGQQD